MPYFNYHSKKIYYSETGKGKPIVFLHGDAVSSKMFEPILFLYKHRFKIILIDFLGCGQSDRVEKFPADLWQEQAHQVIALLEHLNCGRACLMGTSGGAWAAVNAALERPDLIAGAVADSFDGRTLGEDFSEMLIKERREAKQDEMAVGFYEWCLGTDWEKVVDMNTAALIQCADEKRPLFAKPLNELQVPLMLMGSRTDEMVKPDFLEEYKVIAQMTGAETCIFPDGFHPAVISNAEQAADAVYKFFH